MAYVVAKGMGPMKAVILGSRGYDLEVRVTWLPTKHTSTRVVPARTIRPWLRSDDDWWTAARVRSTEKRIASMVESGAAVHRRHPA